MALFTASTVKTILTVGEADSEFGGFSGVRGHRRPFSVPDLVFAERDSLALASATGPFRFPTPPPASVYRPGSTGSGSFNLSVM